MLYLRAALLLLSFFIHDRFAMRARETTLCLPLPACATPLRRLALLVLGALLASLWAAKPAAAQIHRLPSARPDTSFGAAVALDGNRALVSASGENVCGANAGAAYVFEKDSASGTWQKAARLTPSDCEAGAFFGRTLALSGDRALIGASKEFFADERPNVAYVFERDAASGIWRETARLSIDPRNADGTFAASVSLDGDRALVTARADLPAGGGAASTGGGAAFVFEYDARTGRWMRTSRLVPHAADPDRAFGGAGALDGDRAVVTASPYAAEHAGAVYVFERRAGEGGNGRWMQVARLEGIDDFSIPVALDGDRLLVGESRAGDDHQGAATFFERRPGGGWARTATLHPRTPYRDGAFGTTVSLSGRRALITGYDEQLGLDFNIDRVVYAFEEVGGRWLQQQILDIGDVAFGTAIDHDDTTALVGRVPARGSGAAYVVGLQ